LPVSVFCVLQGSWSNTFKVLQDILYGFCCKFHGKYDSEKIENRSTFVKVMNECVMAQFLLRHGVYCIVGPYVSIRLMFHINVQDDKDDV